MGHHLARTIVWFLPLLIASGCGGGSSTQSCDVDLDCDPPALCIHGECKATRCESDLGCVGTLICIEGFCGKPQCVEDGECPAQHRCLYGRCTRVECREKVDCQAEYHCEEYVCVVDECALDSDCEPTEACVEGVCEVVLECATDGECEWDKACEDGVCIDRCWANSDCPRLTGCFEGHCYPVCDNDPSCIEPDRICEHGLCVPAECLQDEDCTGEQVRCNRGRCETFIPCSNDEDCEFDFKCIEDNCQERPLCDIDDDCLDNCLDVPCVCEENHCHEVVTCEQEDDCDTNHDCIGGICVDHYCRGPIDCDPDDICVDGACSPGGNPNLAARVIMVTPGGPVLPGQEIPLVAIVLDANHQSIPGLEFEWTSSHPLNAYVTDEGVLVGGESYGPTQVTVRIAGTMVASDPVTFICKADAVAGTLRVLVVDSIDRKPVEGVLVQVNHGQQVEQAITDLEGEAILIDPGETADIHVFSEDYDYVSVLGVDSSDILVALPPRSHFQEEGGITGKILAFPGEGNASLALAGTSLAINLVKLNFVHLMGEFFAISVNLGQVIRVNVPAMIVLYYSYVGIGISIKPTFYALGQLGMRTSWALGGKFDSSIVSDLFDVNTTDDILVALFPYFAGFSHALNPAIEVISYPRVQDNDDIDGDYNTTELRPDWASFEHVELTPDRPLELATLVHIPDLPTRDGIPIRATLIAIGSMTSWGLTPLGLSGAEGIDGVVPDTVAKAAPMYGGLEVGDYLTAVFAVPPGTTTVLPDDMAMVVHQAKNLPAEVVFESGFLPFPEDVAYDEGTRRMTAGAIDGATLFLGTLSGVDGGWEIYLPAGGDVDFTLPAVPDGMSDLAVGAHTVTLGPITLSHERTFLSLISFNGYDLDKLNYLMSACTRYEM